MASQPVLSEAEALRRLCWEKCRSMDLKNHKTAFNALHKIGDPHLSNLKRMGYSRQR